MNVTNFVAVNLSYAVKDPCIVTKTCKIDARLYVMKLPMTYVYKINILTRARIAIMGNIGHSCSAPAVELCRSKTKCIYFKWNTSSVCPCSIVIVQWLCIFCTVMTNNLFRFVKCSLNSIHRVTYQCDLLKAEHTLCIRCGTVPLAIQTTYLFILNINSAATSAAHYIVLCYK